MFKQIAAGLTLSAGLFAAVPSFAGVYAVTVHEGLTNGSSFDTTQTNPFGNTGASAAFTYTGPINFVDQVTQNSGPSGDLNSVFGFSTANVSGYGGSGTVSQGGTPVADFTSLGSFLASSGSASSFQYASWFSFDLGSLAVGTVLDIVHDDGVSVYQGSTRIGSTVSGATTKTEDVVKVASGADTVLYYSRQNGTPSILQVAVPEPASIALFGAGLLGLTMVVRRRRA